MVTKPYCLILGATSDIGNAIAYRFASEGFHLQLAARNCERLAPTKSDLTIRFGTEVQLIEFDARDFQNHSAAMNLLNPLPNVVVCVFGVLGNQDTAFLKWNEAEEIIASNYTGAVSCLNILAAKMEERKSGTIIGISSVAGDRGRMSNFIYGSAKAGFTAYLSGLRNRLFHSGVHVVIVKPGFVDTKMTKGLPLPKPLTAMPNQVADTVYRAYVSGKNVVYSLWMWRWIMLIIGNIPEAVF